MSSPLVLAVDDSLDDILLLQNACRKAKVQFQLQVVNDGQKAIDYINETTPSDEHRAPSLMLLDLKMPRKSGFEVLAWVRKQPDWRKLPVIIFSSSQHDMDIDRAYAAGADCYILKPVGFDALMQIVKSVDQSITTGSLDFGPLTELPFYKPPD